MANSIRNTLKYLLVSRHPFFAHLVPDKLNEIIQLMEIVVFNAGEVIVREGDFVDGFFLIAKGKVTGSHHEDHHAIPVIELEAGDAIFSTQGRQSVTFVAANEVCLLKLSIQKFHAFLLTDPHPDKTVQKVLQWMLKLEFIKQVGPFVHLTNSQIYSLAEKITELNVPKDTIIFLENEIADCCYFLRAGKVEVTKIQNETIYHYTLEAPTFFGEVGLLTTGRRLATAKSTEECHLLVLHQSAITELLKNDDDFIQPIVAFMVNRFIPEKNKNVIEYQYESKEAQKIVTLEQTELGYFYHLTQETWSIWQLIDGVRTVHDITVEFFNKFNLFMPDSICNLLYDMAKKGFVVIPPINEKVTVVDNKSRLQRIKNKIFSSVQYEYFISNFDSYLEKMYNKFFWIIFTVPFQIVFALVVATGFGFFIASYQSMNPLEHNYKHYFILFLVLLIPIHVLTVILHEIAHALTVKSFGYKVQRIGFGWNALSPFAFADTSQMWIAERNQKIAVDIAGVYTDIFCAGILAIIAYFLKDNAYAVIFWLLSLFTYFHAFKNMSLLEEHDGYYFLSDLLDEPQLRANSITWAGKGFTASNDSQYKTEKIYWFCCGIYLLMSVLFLYFLLKMFFEVFQIKSIFNFNAESVAIYVSLVWLLLAIIKIGMNIFRKR